MSQNVCKICFVDAGLSVCAKTQFSLARSSGYHVLTCFLLYIYCVYLALTYMLASSFISRNLIRFHLDCLEFY